MKLAPPTRAHSRAQIGGSITRYIAKLDLDSDINGDATRIFLMGMPAM